MSEKEEQKNLGIRIAERRRELNLTQEELSNRLGVTPQALSQYERGLRYPDVGLLKNLCKILQISADYLLGTEVAEVFDKENPVLQDEVWKLLRHTLEPVKLILGGEITPAFLTEDSSALVSEARTRLAREGALLPVVNMMDLLSLKPREFIITAYDNVIYQEEIASEQAISVEYIIGKLEEAVRKNYAEILSPDLMKNLADNLKINHPALINGVVPEMISYLQLTSICKAFLHRGNTLVYLPKMIEVMAEKLRDGKPHEDEELLEAVVQRVERKDNLWVYLAERKNG